MAAIARSRPQPLEQHTIVDTRRKYRYVRMKEMLSNALGGSRGRGLFSTADQGSKGAGSSTDAGTGPSSAPPANMGGAETAGQFGEPSKRPSLIQQAIGGQQRAAMAAQIPPRKSSLTATTG